MSHFVIRISLSVLEGAEKIWAKKCVGQKVVFVSSFAARKVEMCEMIRDDTPQTYKKIFPEFFQQE